MSTEKETLQASHDALVRNLEMAAKERDAMAARLAELEGQEPVAWIYDWQAPEGLIKGWVETNRDAIPEHATNIRPLYARPAPAEPVNARLLDVAVWPAGYCRDPNGKMSIPAGKEEDFNFGYDVGFEEAWEILNSAISAIYGNHQMGAGQLAENIAVWSSQHGRFVWWCKQ